MMPYPLPPAILPGKPLSALMLGLSLLGGCASQPLPLEINACFTNLIEPTT